MWSEANSREEIKTAKTVGTTSLSLFKHTPLKISSSENGEIKMVANSPMPDIECDRPNDGMKFKTWSERYKNPYDKNTFNTTIIIICPKTLAPNTPVKSDFSGRLSLSLYMKYNINTRYIQKESKLIMLNAFKKYWIKNKKIIKDNTSFRRISPNFSLNKDILSWKTNLYTLI